MGAGNDLAPDRPKRALARSLCARCVREGSHLCDHANDDADPESMRTTLEKVIQKLDGKKELALS